MKDKAFYACCFGVIFGIFLRSFIAIDIYALIFFALISISLLLFFSFISKRKLGIIFSIFLFAFCLGVFRFHIYDKINPDIFETKVGKEFSFSGLIIDEPSVAENNQKLIIETGLAPQGLALDSLKARPFPAKSRILVSTNFDESFKYGDEISFKGILEKPENFITDQGKEFDYVNYLKKDGIFYVMKYPKIDILSHSNGSFIKSILFSAKEKFLDKINFVIPEPESLLMGGLILGEKSSFGQELRQSFVNTGTIHIVALSGYNVTIVAEWFMKLFSFLPINFSIFAGILAILLFILMTGGSSTAIRAGVMATLALIARATGRNYDVARALILSGVVMLLFNPLLLVYDVSFQLSFLATIAVIFLTPKIEKYFFWVTERFGLRDVVSITFSAYIFVMPFILYKMGNLSLVALPTNVLVLPFIPFTMLLGFVTGFIGLISSILAIPLGYISYFFLHYELFIINLFSNIPFSSISISNFPLFITILIYIVFIYKIFGTDVKKLFTVLPE